MDTTTKLLCDRIRADYLYNPKAYHKEVMFLEDKPNKLFQHEDDEIDRFAALRRLIQSAEKRGEIKRKFK